MSIEKNQIKSTYSTLIKDLDEKNLLNHIKSENISDDIVDLSLPLKTRIEYIEEFYKKFGENECIEIISRLSTMYQMSGTKILEKYMYEIAVNSNISPFLKIVTTKSLIFFDKKNILGYEALNIICKNFINEIATPCQIDVICLLMQNKKYKKEARDYFCVVINNFDLECDYRYKTILSLETKNMPNKLFFIKEATLDFFLHSKNIIFYRILAGQYLLQKCLKNLDSLQIVNIENTILSFSYDITLEYNLRADASDVILKLGSIENKTKAKNIIMLLGKEGNKGESKTIFDNAQNVHIDDIEESVLETISFLSTIEICKKEITFDYVKHEIIKDIDTSKYDLNNIQISLNRIYLDRALYSKYNCSLVNILLKIWVYMSTHTCKLEMKTRLLEELVEMSGTCSSGFASRLVNVLSGFGDFNLKISWRDQLIANFTGRLNAKARDITNINTIKTHCNLYGIKIGYKNEDELKEELELFQEKVLEEMMIKSNEYCSRINFLKFFRKNMLGIREELYEEFKTHIDDTSFDLYCRSAIANYETGGYV